MNDHSGHLLGDGVDGERSVQAGLQLVSFHVCWLRRV